MRVSISVSRQNPLPAGEFRRIQLRGGDFAVDRARVEQLFMAALPDDGTVVEHEDAVRVHYGRDALCDDQDRTLIDWV